MDEKKTYAGRIQNTGSQKVDALFQQPKAKGSTVERGSDLRNGGGKTGGK